MTHLSIVTYLPTHFHLIHSIYQSPPHSCILSTKVHLIHFIDHSPLQKNLRIWSHLLNILNGKLQFLSSGPSQSHLPYLVILILHCYSTTLSPLLFNQSRLWKLGVSLDKALIWNTYPITWSWTTMVLLLIVNLEESQHPYLHFNNPEYACISLLILCFRYILQKFFTTNVALVYFW